MSHTIRLVELSAPSEVAADTQIGNIVLCDNFANADILPLFLQNGVKHLVQKSNFDSEAELKVSSIMLLNPDKFIQFPLSCIFGVNNPSESTEKNLCDVSAQLSHPQEKTKILDQIDVFVENIAKAKSVGSDIRIVSDELLTNSLFNAPYVNYENSFSGPTRDISKISIEVGKKPHIFVGHNEHKIVVGCKDHYGRLNVASLIQRILRCYVQNISELLNFGPGGAGIGTFMIFNSCSSMYVAVDSGKSTTICCAFPRALSARKRASLPKNFHVFQR